MSDDLFYGRPISNGLGALSFDLCEICQRKTPIWLESKFENDMPIVRFTCEECHEKESEQKKFNEDAFYTRPSSENEELPETTRPAWMNEFIDGQKQSGAIDTIGDITEIEPEIAEFSEPEEQYQAESDQEYVSDIDEEEVIPQAHWSAGFIQEALFGPNPEEWLEKQGGYNSEALQLTISTLTAFSNNQVSGVKLSAILCLAGLVRRDSSSKNDVIGAIERFTNDEDESVGQFAKQTIDQLK